MRAFIDYLIAYLRSTSRPALIITILFVASLVAANYTIGIESRIRALPWYLALAGFFFFMAPFSPSSGDCKHNVGPFQPSAPRAARTSSRPRSGIAHPSANQNS